MLDSVKKRELRKLLKLIQKDDNLIVLLGDFNLKNNNKKIIKLLFSDPPKDI